jgi:calcineurin-like phosphoesterase family protein
MKFYPTTRGSFSTIEELNEKMIANWNELIKYDDEVYYLGDLSFGGDDKTHRLLNRLNGKIFYLRGNHDKGIQKHIKRFQWLKDIAEIKINDLPITLCHYAMRTWNKSHFGAWQLYGHSHGGLEEDPIAKSMDVGVDTNNFYPYHYDEVRKRMDKKPGYLIHHGRDRSEKS